LVDICRYESPTNLQNLTQKDLTEVKIFQNVLGGGATFLKHAVESAHHKPRMTQTAVASHRSVTSTGTDTRTVISIIHTGIVW